MAVASQSLHGLTWGVMMVVSVAFIADSVPPHLRASGQGLLAMALAASNGAWSVLAGRISDRYTTAAMFLVISFVSLVALGVGFFVREPKKTELRTPTPLDSTSLGLSE